MIAAATGLENYVNDFLNLIEPNLGSELCDLSKKPLEEKNFWKAFNYRMAIS